MVLWRRHTNHSRGTHASTPPSAPRTQPNLRSPVPATQTKNGAEILTARENKLARFNESGEVGYWKVVRRPIPGAPKRKTPLGNEGIDYFVLDIPEQGPRKNLIVSYEVCAKMNMFALVGAVCFVASGGGHPTDRLVVCTECVMERTAGGSTRLVCLIPRREFFCEARVDITSSCMVSRAHRTRFPIRWAPSMSKEAVTGRGAGVVLYSASRSG